MNNAIKTKSSVEFPAERLFWRCSEERRKVPTFLKEPALFTVASKYACHFKLLFACLNKKPRFCANVYTSICLHFRNNNEPMHLKISCRNGKFILGQNSKPYDSIPDMINHYSLNTLNIRGAEQVKLIYPVIHEAMYFTVEPGS